MHNLGSVVSGKSWLVEDCFVEGCPHAAACGRHGFGRCFHPAVAASVPQRDGDKRLVVVLCPSDISDGGRQFDSSFCFVV